MSDPISFLLIAGAVLLVAAFVCAAFRLLTQWLWHKMFDVPAVGYVDESKPSDWL